jgi:hypothetical protein
MPKLEFRDAASLIGTLKFRCAKFAYPGSQEYLELHEMIDGLCVLYLSVPEKQRAEIRNLAADVPRAIDNQLLSHIGWAAERVWLSKDGEWVRKGLAAASIEDNRSDFRDTFVGLGSLYVAASSSGIDCSPYFQEAAELSSTEGGHYMSLCSMREFLSKFEKSAYFNHDVRPFIGKYESPRVRSEILNVLADIWDPLGVKNGRFSRKEYDSYSHDIYKLLVGHSTVEDMTEHLCSVARRRMEMEPPPSTPDAVRALRAVKLGENET